MSVEAPITEADNWFIGEDKVLRFYVTEGPDIKTTAAAAKSATAISVQALTEALDTGDKVRFMRGGANIVATLTADAAIGDTSLTVAALAGAIAVGTVGRKVRDCTSETAQWTLRDGPAAATALLTKTPSFSDESNGVCDVAIADTDTIDETSGAIKIQPGRYFHTLRKTNDADESILAYGEAVLRLAGTR